MKTKIGRRAEEAPVRVTWESSYLNVCTVLALCKVTKADKNLHKAVRVFSITQLMDFKIRKKHKDKFSAYCFLID